MKENSTRRRSERPWLRGKKNYESEDRKKGNTCVCNNVCIAFDESILRLAGFLRKIRTRKDDTTMEDNHFFPRKKNLL